MLGDASTITMTACLNTHVNIDLAYDLLSVVHPRNEDGTRFIHPKNTREKIPYFDIPNAIVCIKYKGQIRGIRQNEGQMNNVVSIDLQNCGKNINLKLAKTTLQLTGAKSEEAGKNAFDVLCCHINMIQEYLDYSRSLSKELREEVYDWVRRTAQEQSSQQGKELRSASGDGTNVLVSGRSLTFLDMDKCESAPDTKLASYLWSYAEDFDDYEKYEKKLNFVIDVIESSKDSYVDKQSLIVGEGKEQSSQQGKTLSLVPSDSVGVKVVSTNISNSVYNYSLGKEVSLIKLSTFLMNKGFNVDFHNWSSSQLKVAIVDDGEETKSPARLDEAMSPKLASETLDGKVPKLKTHRFSLTRNLSIKQTSSTPYSKALKAHNTFMEGLEGFLESGA